MKTKTIGIIGGMGPLATVDLFHKIVAHTEAASDREHLHILIDNNPAIPDRTAAILNNGPSPLAEMQKSAKLLENMGANLLVIPCNTAHYFHDRIQKSVHVPLLDMIRITALECRDRGFQTVGLLSTTGTAKAGIYHRTLGEMGIRCLVPPDSDLEQVMEYIYRYKAGDPIKNLEPLREIAENLRSRGAEAVILGCTELPLIFSQLEVTFPCIDPSLLLSLEAIRQAGAQITRVSGCTACIP